ncbi:hypothetical protein ACFQO1_09185 [Jejudonia soesokkakensis]|uniref:Uncharacterized protein n=1 Tax=Jejudonia soesokkakensis TaxID=1323432 RepID=A0ABW2MVJ4_9FLAO
MRILKIMGWVLLSAIIICIAVVGYSYYNYFGKFSEDTTTYPNYIGYIDQEKALQNDTYTLCEGNIYKIHHGAPKDAYQGGKNTFDAYVMEQYKNENYTDSGYINFRFLVTCEGNPGWFEILEIDLDYEKTKHNPKLVSQLLEITSKSSNWAVYKIGDTPQNYYHYVSYRIEHGEITEILP